MSAALNRKIPPKSPETMNKPYLSTIPKLRARCLYLPVLIVYIITIVVFIMASFFVVQLIAKRQGDLVYQKTIQAGRIGLNHFVNVAVIPLLDDDALTLNALLKEAATIDGILYAAVIDEKGIVKAHTDLDKIGTTFGRFEKIEQESREGDTMMQTYPLPAGDRVLDLSRPVTFMKKNIGAVHVGLSLLYIDGEIKKEMSGSMRALVMPGLFAVGLLLGLALALFFSLRRAVYGQADTSSEQRTEQGQACRGDEAAAIPSCSASDDTIGYNSDDPRGSLMPEMKQNHVTVLFAGIKGFRAYAEINDHNKLMEDLNGYLSLATDCIRTFGGHIDKFIGDAVIAVFSNSSHEADHAERALNAAVAMQKALQDSGKNGNPLLLKVGIGISSGVVLTGCVGSPAKKEHTFIGESIKVAYSLNVMAGPGEIIMSRDAYQMIEHRVIVEPLPPREMMQRTDAWENFRLLKIIDLKDNPRHLDYDNNTSSIT